MSSPTSAEPISVRPDALQALAAELSALAGALAEDADLCRSTGHSFRTALGDTAGWTAQSATTTWAGLQDLLAESAATLARTLVAAANAHAEQDLSLAARVAAGLPLGAPGPR